MEQTDIYAIASFVLALICGLVSVIGNIRQAEKARAEEAFSKRDYEHF